MPFQPAPIERDPRFTVESLHPYPQPDGAIDYGSEREMHDFLEERIQGE